MILPNTATLCLRLAVAALYGAALGAERSFRRKDAGIRTHSILALATALFMILSKYAFFGDQGGADPTMIACQVVMGINFLGAGIIFRSKQVASHGLTTAAGDNTLNLILQVRLKNAIPFREIMQRRSNPSVFDILSF